MREPKRLSAREVALDEISLGERLRPASGAAVEALMASIEEMGQALTPIALRDHGGRLELMAGLHRLEAYRRLGRETIWAEIWDCTGDWARLAEIDENLAGADLSIVEMAQFLAARKRVYEKLHPETRHGGDRVSELWIGDQNDTVSFCSAIASKRGISRRHAERLTRLGRTLDVEAGAILKRLETPPSYRELVRLCEMPGMRQAEAAGLLRDGKAATLKAAIAVTEPERQPVKTQSPEEQAFRDLRERFDRAPMAAKRRFLGHLFEAYGQLIRDADEAGAGRI